jgi:hypothetical protein
MIYGDAQHSAFGKGDEGRETKRAAQRLYGKQNCASIGRWT